MAKDEKDGIDRRGALECMIWAGTGVMAANVPRSSLLGISKANAQAASGFTFLKISDSHTGEIDQRRGGWCFQCCSSRGGGQSGVAKLCQFGQGQTDLV
jgi:hypothetical protein